MKESVSKESYDNDLPGPVSEWKPVNSSNCMVRRLRGAELLVNYSERFCNGNFQLTMMASLETPLTCEQLRRRHHAAWWRTRQMCPVVGVAFDLGKATFELHSTVEMAKRWAEQTCRVATNTTVSDVYLAQSRQQSNTPTMSLVVDPVRGSRGYVLNMSHTLVSLGIFRIMQEYMTQLARPDSELGIDSVFAPETIADIRPRLPQSLCHAYALHHQPTEQELHDALQIHQRAQERWTRSTIGIPLHPDWQNRTSRIQNKVVTFEPDEARAAFKSFKKLGITLTTAFFACMTSGIARTFGTGDEDGAHLLFSGNARKWPWVDSEGRGGHGPVSMSILPAGMWIDSRTANLRADDKPGLLRLAKAIERAQEEDMASPHVIAIYDRVAPALAKAMGEPQAPSAAPFIARPTLTSQGHFSDHRPSRPGQDRMRMTDFNTGGRNTDPNVCFALNSFRDELRYNLLFDERFFVQEDVMQLAHVVSALFRRLVAEEPVPAKL